MRGKGKMGRCFHMSSENKAEVLLSCVAVGWPHSSFECNVRSTAHLGFLLSDMHQTFLPSRRKQWPTGLAEKHWRIKDSRQQSWERIWNYLIYLPPQSCLPSPSAPCLLAALLMLWPQSVLLIHCLGAKTPISSPSLPPGITLHPEHLTGPEPHIKL